MHNTVYLRNGFCLTDWGPHVQDAGILGAFHYSYGPAAASLFLCDLPQSRGPPAVYCLNLLWGFSHTGVVETAADLALNCRNLWRWLRCLALFAITKMHISLIYTLAETENCTRSMSRVTHTKAFSDFLALNSFKRLQSLSLRKLASSAFSISMSF